MSVISFFSTLAKTPFVANPSEDLIEIYRIILRVALAIFVITVFLGIKYGHSAQTLSKDYPLQFRLAARFRIPTLMFVIIPVSFVRSLHFAFGDWYRRNMSDGPKDTHEARVQYVVKQIKNWNENGRKSMMRTSRPTWTNMSTKISSKGTLKIVLYNRPIQWPLLIISTIHTLYINIFPLCRWCKDHPDGQSDAYLRSRRATPYTPC